MKAPLLAISLLLGCCFSALAQEADSSLTDSKHQVKDGFSLGGVPVVAYDSDIGFKYGALLNFYWYDSLRYPMYDHSLYLEWSRTTKGNGINQITYETDKLIPGIRALFEVSYLTEKALDFYGFNGYQAVYDLDYEQKGMDAEGFSNRLFYRHARELLRIKADFQGKLSGDHLRWLGGLSFYGASIEKVDIDKLNEGKDSEDLLSQNSLYQSYVDWGLIKEDQAAGGNHTILKGGLLWDSRDNEPNPFKGIWSEMQLHYAPSFLSNTDYSYARIILTHRQYFTIIPDWMNLAYRLSYQGKVAGEVPFYMLPFMYQSAPKLTRDGIGGSKTVRGVRRNRIAGDGFAFGNLELRSNVLRTVVFNQNFYIALSAFVDGGMVTQKFDFDSSGMPDQLPDDYPEQILDLDAKEVPHVGFGGGVHFIINHNFIVTADYGLAARKEDGDSGLYINLNYLF